MPSSSFPCPKKAFSPFEEYKAQFSFPLPSASLQWASVAPLAGSPAPRLVAFLPRPSGRGANCELAERRDRNDVPFSLQGHGSSSSASAAGCALITAKRK